MHAAVARPHDGPGLPYDVFHLSAALATIGEVLRDPDIHVRAVLAYSSRPNGMQKEHFVQAYLDAARPGDALEWLEGDWGPLEPTRRSLLSDTLGSLGRTAEGAEIRRELFEASLSTFDLNRSLEHLPAARPQARRRARDLALKHGDAVTAATLLLDWTIPTGLRRRSCRQMQPSTAATTATSSRWPRRCGSRGARAARLRCCAR